VTDQLRVSLIQHAASLDPAQNRAAVAELTPAGCDLVVFPEVFARDFGLPGSDVSGFAETLDGPFATAVDRVARDRGTTVVAGMFEAGPDPLRPFNTLVVRGAVQASYRKIHLYDSFGFRESDGIAAGPLGAVTVDLCGFRVGLMTCYDLRFPELSRALLDAGAEVLVVPAAWVAGERKVDHWRTLVRARAIENVVWVVAAGQPGPRYSGHTMLVDPWGEVVVEAGTGPEVLSGVVRREALTEARRTNPSLANRRL
jgi:predicted amidohydrolase